MSCDSFLLDEFEKKNISSPLLRVYGWKEKTLSLGVNQNLDHEAINVPVVKRISGGQAVLHGNIQDELTYSVLLSSLGNFKKIYFTIGQILIHFLNKYGLSSRFGYQDNNYRKHFDCFNSRTEADIVVGNIKVIGSAQCRRNMNILQHGSIRLDIIRQLSGLNVSFDEVKENLKSSFTEKLNIKFLDYSLSKESCEKINKANYHELICC